MFPPFHPCQYPHVHATKTRISGDYFQSSCLTQSTYSKLLLERLSEAVKDVETLLCRSNGAENQIFILPTEHQLYNYSLVKSASVPASNGECTFQIYQICLVWRLVPSRRFLQLKSTLNKVYLIDQVHYDAVLFSSDFFQPISLSNSLSISSTKLLVKQEAAAVKLLSYLHSYLHWQNVVCIHCPASCTLVHISHKPRSSGVNVLLNLFC